MRIRFTHRGSFSNTEKFLKKFSDKDYRSMLSRYGQTGVLALQEKTPVDSGETRSSWEYKIEKTSYGYSLSWYNTVMAGTTPLVILLHYGHGTRGGTYVPGVDFINPAMKPVLEEISNDIWKEVTSV